MGPQMRDRVCTVHAFVKTFGLHIKMSCFVTFGITMMIFSPFVLENDDDDEPSHNITYTAIVTS